MTIQVDNALPPNVVEIGNEITQGVIDGLMSASPAPSSSNPFFTTGGGQMTGTLIIDNNDAGVTIELNPITGLSVLQAGIQTSSLTVLEDTIYGTDGDGGTYALSSNWVGGSFESDSWQIGITGVTFPDSTIQTTAAVSPTFATTEQAQAGTSTTTVINPATLREMLMTSNVTKINFSVQIATTGTGGTNDGAGTDFLRLTCPNSAANVVVTRYRPVNVQKGSSLSANMSFANGVALAFRLSLGSTTGTDPNSTGVIAIGEGTVTTAVLPSVRSIGVQLNYGSNIKILAHDGTTLTTFTTSTSVASLYINACDFLLTNDYATGTVTLYLNGVSIGSTTGGVTSHASGFNARNQFNARAFNQSVPSGSQLNFTIFGATAIVL